MVKNILTGGFAGKLYIVNPKETKIQGIKVTPSVHDLPQVDMGVLAVASSFCKEAVDVLVHQKGAKAIIIISSGFSEETPEGGVIEKEIQRICSQAGFGYGIDDLWNGIVSHAVAVRCSVQNGTNVVDGDFGHAVRRVRKHAFAV